MWHTCKKVWPLWKLSVSVPKDRIISRFADVRASGVSTLFCTLQNNSKMNSSSDFLTWLVEGPMSAKQFCTVTLNNTFLVYIFNLNTIDDKLKCGQRLHEAYQIQDFPFSYYRCVPDVGDRHGLCRWPAQRQTFSKYNLNNVHLKLVFKNKFNNILNYLYLKTRRQTIYLVSFWTFLKN